VGNYSGGDPYFAPIVSQSLRDGVLELSRNRSRNRSETRAAPIAGVERARLVAPEAVRRAGVSEQQSSQEIRKITIPDAENFHTDLIKYRKY
jgi:hypothetical protein